MQKNFISDIKHSLVNSQGALREECKETMWHFLQRRGLSSVDIFESLLKGIFGMKLWCKCEVAIEDFFGTFHKENNFSYAWN